MKSVREMYYKFSQILLILKNKENYVNFNRINYCILFTANIIRVVKSRRLAWAEHAEWKKSRVLSKF